MKISDVFLILKYLSKNLSSPKKYTVIAFVKTQLRQKDLSVNTLLIKLACYYVERRG